MAHFAYLIEAKLLKMLMSIFHLPSPLPPQPSNACFCVLGGWANGFWFGWANENKQKETERWEERGHVFPLYCLSAYGLSKTLALANWSLLQGLDFTGLLLAPDLAVMGFPLLTLTGCLHISH